MPNCCLPVSTYRCYHEHGNHILSSVCCFADGRARFNTQFVSVPRLFSCPLVLKDSDLQEVTTLGQPLEVLKTQMAANRSQTMLQATQSVWARGGVAGFYQGLIPWVCDRAILPM